MKIDVKCKSETFLPLNELTDFQGNLKFRTVTDMDNIAESIIEFGFSFPFFVWRNRETNYIIDGHGRLEALIGLAAKGYEIPELPVVYVNAANRDEAKNLLLRVNSLYGQIDRDELLTLIEETGASVISLSYPDLDLNFGKDIESIGVEIYEPAYEPIIDTAEVKERDIERAEEKISDINKDHEFVEFTCRDCGSLIYVKREAVLRYLKGEAV